MISCESADVYKRQPEWFDAQFTGCDTIAPQLNTLLTDVEDLPRINELAQALQELKASGQLTKFKAVVSATQCESCLLYTSRCV